MRLPWQKKEVNKAVKATTRRSFDAAKVDRLTAAFTASRVSIDRELRGQINLIRARSRGLFRNNEYAKKFGRMVRRNVVGPAGFTLQAQSKDDSGELARLDNQAIEQAFKRFSRKGVCEISGRYSQADAERALITSAARDGEFLVRLIRGAAAGNAFGFAYQILDIDRLDTMMNIEPSAGRNAVVMGVEMDAYRRPVAYWIFKSHPNGMGGNRERERVPAHEILHDFLPDDEPESARGIPWMHAAMRTLHDLGGYREAAVIASRVGASTMGIITKPEGCPSELATNSPASDEDYEVEMEPGTFPVVPEGTVITQFDPAYPHQQFDMFMKSCLRGISSGFGVAYNSFANDLEGVSFSSIRAGTLEERDEWTMLQNWFAEAFHIPIYEAWLEMALLSGAIVAPNGAQLPATKLNKFKNHTWQGRRWAWVDPLKDMQANIMAIRNGLSSPQRVAASIGVDVEDILDELARFDALLKSKGVELPSAEGVPAKPSLTDAGDADTENEAAVDSAEESDA